MCFKTLSRYSQPYLYEKDSEINLWCCYAEDSIYDIFGKQEYLIKPWKIHIIKNILSNSLSIRPDLPNIIDGYGKILIECNPCCYKANNIITYTCGIKKDYKSAVIYYVVSAEQDDNKFYNLQVLHKAFNGVINNGFLYCVSGANMTVDIVDLKTKKIVKTKKIIYNEYTSIIRITKLYDSNNMILTTGGKKGNASILVNSELEILKNVTYNQKDIYKCSIYKDYLAYTVKNDTVETNLENRSIQIVKL